MNIIMAITRCVKLKAISGIFLLFFFIVFWHIAPVCADTFNVTNNNDDENEGSLRWAINKANKASIAQTIAFIGDIGTISLSSDLPDLAEQRTFDLSNAVGTVTLKGYTLEYGTFALRFSGGTMSFDDGAILSGTGSISIGYDASNSLNIENGGQVNSGIIYIGYSGLTGAVTVDGTGSKLSTGTKNLTVGYTGEGTLDVRNGGEVSGAVLNLGSNSASKGTVTVDGAGSKCTLSNIITVGSSSSSESVLDVTNGGEVSGKTLYIGFNLGSKGAVTVDGASSELILTSNSYVGYSGTGKLTISDDATVSINGGAGTLTLGNGSSSSGTLNIGAGAAAGTLLAATVTGGSGASTLNFNHNETSYTFSPNITGTLDLNHTGTGKTILTGATIYTGTTTVSAGTLDINQARSLTGDITLNGAGTLELGASTLTHTGTYTQNSGTQLKIQLSDSGFGNISSSGIASISAASTLDINITGALSSGSYEVIDSASGSGVNVPNLSWNRAIYSITGSTSDNDLYLNVIKQSYETVALNPNAAAVGRALDSAPTLGDMATVKEQLDSLALQQEISDAMNAMAPLLDEAQVNVTNNVLGEFNAAAILRLQDSDAIDEKVPEGKLSQVSPDENNLWAQTYGDYVYQDKRGLSNGYIANLWGTVIGIDRIFLQDNLRLGLAQGFGWSHIRSKDNYGRTRFNSYQTGFYGEYDSRSIPLTFDAVLTYGYNDYESSRKISVGSINRTAQSDYSGQQFSSYFEGGYKITKNNFDIIPLIAVDYTYLHISGYTENGADSLNLSVDSQDYNALQLGVGCRLMRAFEYKNNILTPELHLRYFYSAVNDEQQTVASFAGGGTAFQTTGFRPAPSSVNFGGRFEFFNKKNITLLAGFDTAFKSDYYEAGGSLTVKYSF